MRVGVYVDGFNLYFGARAVCGRGTPGWRWLDIRALASTLIEERWAAFDPVIEQVVYCTARVSGAEDPSSPTEQDVYLRALQRHRSVDRILFGHFVSRLRVAPLAERDEHGRPRSARSRWPIQVRDASGADVPGASFMVSFIDREEKGTDVNLATHLLVDVLDRNIDGAIVISNDSDLALPVRVARQNVSVGIANPGRRPMAGNLKGSYFEGPHEHWWARLDASMYRDHQLPDVVGPLSKPPGW